MVQAETPRVTDMATIDEVWEEALRRNHDGHSRSESKVMEA